MGDMKVITPMKVIGLTGIARSGKDTVAQIIQEEVDGRIERQGFADRLKLSAARLFYPDIDQEAAIEFCDYLKSSGGIGWALDDTGVQDKGITGRQFLQRYGTEAHRNVFGEDFWLDAVLPEGRDDCDVLVVPDVRFDNEAVRVYERGGEVWRLVRDVPGVESHASEVGVSEELVLVRIENAGTLQDLRVGVRAVLESSGLPLRPEGVRL
jgi:hypothetical protein